MNHRDLSSNIVLKDRPFINKLSMKNLSPISIKFYK